MHYLTKTLGLFSALALVTASFAQLPQKLERGGDFSIRIIDGRYVLTGGLGGSGSFRSSALRFEFLPNAGLDWQLRVRDLVNAINSDYMLRWNTTILPNGDIRWDMDATPNECTTLRIGSSDINFKLTRIWGRITLRLSELTCQADPHGRLNRSVTVQMDETGGDQNNYLRLEGYAFCVEQPLFFTEGNVFQLDIRGYGGGLPKSQGNLNNDCVVDDADLLIVLFNFGTSDAANDVNGDGIVDDADLLIVLFNFGLEG
ncbi:MAG: hypothetical protein N2651_06795 [Fimbriimonadales bacterium]|nr:hypothetical protein [Fimbriimonadales bacterium]